VIAGNVFSISQKKMNFLSQENTYSKWATAGFASWVICSTQQNHEILEVNLSLSHTFHGKITEIF